MEKISKSIVMLAVVALCALFLAGHSVGPTAEAQTKRPEETEDPYQDASVLVEAFVVEVELPALYELGISPIGKKPDSVSVENILKCLGSKDIAWVTTGLKIAVHQRASGETGITESAYVKRQRVAEGDRRGDSDRYERYDVSKQFEARVFINTDDRISVGFVFNQNVVKNMPSSGETPPATISRQWSGNVSLDAGVPCIAGSTQDEETAVFLILCADIKSK